MLLQKALLIKKRPKLIFIALRNDQLACENVFGFKCSLDATLGLQRNYS